MTREKEAYERFISLFTDRFNQAFHTDYATNIFEDFENSYSYSVISSTDVYNYRVYLTIGLILLFLLLPSFFLLMNKEISLLLNNGFSLHQVLWCLLGKKKIIITFIIAGIIGGFIFMYYKEQFLYLFQMYVFLFSGIYGISLISLLLVEKIASLREAFNYIQYILFIFGLLFSLLLTVANVELATIVFSSSQLAVSHEPPKEIADEDYYVFYPVTIGKNHVDFIYSNRFASAADQELYETLNKNGSILVNVSDYLNEENEQFGRGIKINLNYLKKFPLIDVSGRLIQITEEETHPVILIPERYRHTDLKNDLAQITEYYQEISEKEPEFLFIKNNQPIYTFIPSIPWIEHYPVVEILTLKNSTYWERNILSGEIYPPLKIKIGSLSKERLFELIEESQLRDNLQLSFPYTQTEEIAVKVLSRSLTGREKRLIKRNTISFLFQDFGLIEYETIDFNLDIGLKFSNLNVSDKRTAKYEALKKVNINKKLSTPIYTLSGGEKQRIACARVLLKNSKIILADEPTGSLDKRNKDKVVEILSQQASQGTLVIVVTHDPYLTKIGNKKIML
ncbi:ATP-binding cassette domain-containing protein [Enterococcus faecium]|nr:ATP-binding cassette domain-containing protein [Enterococcus faecium]